MCGELVGDRAWRPALTLSLPQDGWVSVEAMNMWQDALATPALLTTSPNGTARQDAGVLPGGRVLFGGDDVLDDTLDGIRVRFGIWLDRCHTVGLGAEYFELGELTQQYSQTSTGDPILARPFFNTLTGREDSELIAFPEVVSGTATVDVRSALYGGGFHVRRLRGCEEGCREWLFCGCKGHFCTRSEFRLGYRYLQLEEGVSIREELVSNDTSNPGTFDITDRFNTINQFNGVDLGWSHRIVRGYWTLEGLVRIAVGNTRQEVEIAGSTLINDPNDPPAQSYDEGFLALETNSGTHTQDEFSVVPEFDLILGYQLTDHLKATFGYTGLYWSNVVRPGHHIPTMLNPDNLPPDVASNGAPRPQFAFDTTDYWIHGLTYGLEYRW
jgi:hypothetical protein